VAYYRYRNELFFVDAQGGIIEKRDPRKTPDGEFPVITRNADSDWSVQKLGNVLSLLPDKVRGNVSEIVLESFPYFHLFLVSPKCEAFFSFENWESQLPYLADVFRYAPQHPGQVRRINLIFSKKAVVSLSNSK
jgi:hypothetical protein